MVWEHSVQKAWFATSGLDLGLYQAVMVEKQHLVQLTFVFGMGQEVSRHQSPNLPMERFD